MLFPFCNCFRTFEFHTIFSSFFLMHSMQNRPKGPRTSSQIQSCPCQDSSPALSYRDTLVNIQALPRSTLTVGRWSSHLLLHLQARISLASTLKNFKISLSSQVHHTHILLVTQAAITHTQARSPFFISLPIHTCPLSHFFHLIIIISFSSSRSALKLLHSPFISHHSFPLPGSRASLRTLPLTHKHIFHL